MIFICIFTLRFNCVFADVQRVGVSGVKLRKYFILLYFGKDKKMNCCVNSDGGMKMIYVLKNH